MTRRPPPRSRPAGRIAGALLVAVLAASGLGCRRGPPPNLVIVVIDTLRQDHLPCYGYERDTAPTLCRLAAEGARLDGISPTSWTKPATASILTGLHPVRLQVIERSDRLPGDALSLAEILAERGYRTLGLSANNWIQYRFGFDQGFKELHIEPHEPHEPATAREMNERLRRRLPTLAEPYFLYLHYVDPHEPYAPPASWDGSPLDPRLVERGPVSNRQLHLQRFMRRDPQLLRDALDLYDGEIRSVDEGMAAALAMLRRAGLMENTLLIVTSDHGEEFEDHDRGGHGLTLHREVTRVPLVFHFPGRIPPGLTPGAAGLVDIMPTALDLLGVEPPVGHEFDGVSLAPWLTGRRAGSAQPERGFLLHLDLDSRTAIGLVRGRRKLLLAGHPYGKQLFDHQADPGERANLLDRAEGAEEFAALSAELAETYNHLSRRALDQEATTFDDELARRIRALGYIALPSDEPHERTLPPRIRPADPLQGGLLGWERPSSFEPCIEMADPEDFDQLLEGWRYVELKGRWALERASVALPAPRGVEPVLRLSGMNHRGEPFTLLARIDGQEVFRRLIPPGPIRLEERLAPGLFSRRVAVLRLESSPAFLPRERDDWQWRLGVFLRSICLADASTPAAATAGSPAP